MSYRRDDDSHPPLDFEGYRSTKLRHPSQLRPLTQTETELTVPRLGDRPLGAHDHDLTVHGDGEPLGERIIVYGQVREDGGRGVSGKMG
jgi:protocatechuate 3,4-dioxygenase, beta subunit